MKLSPWGCCRITSAACLLALPHLAAAQAPDPLIYVPAHQISGVIHTWGSPQMGDLLKQYEQGFLKVQPSVSFDDQLKSTVTAVAGVYTGRADIGLLGREIWPTEVQAFDSIEHRAPAVIEIATGSYNVPKATFALMIFVPNSNPIASLSMPQLERIFSSTSDPIRTWGDLGLQGASPTRPIHLYGFSIDNDKSQIFSQLVFKKGARWQAGLHEYSNSPGPNSIDAGQLIVEAVAKDPDAIGISNVYYTKPGVKMLALSTQDHPAPIAPTRESVASQLYPLTRAVYMVVDIDPAHPPAPVVVEFLRFILSRQGQDAVKQEGNYLPLPDSVSLKQLLNLPPQIK